ncbi:tRNA (N6-isopentenyl adenosine(37)-C2)-methylthiotransferase MiaB [Puniceicoccales bacterium CK1056]|uniref:tRNA-2-methylthio-N(6)-dimethylallyladenosine synthase n=1 Tax=Oceanipulchritudo coccoides TaxID=2706888 RepID=A0A6B2M575_9BACT|nr:tRNA (N6-isopentenyl adenosine(37)-C2)-methylthiotransferase MiaB [Oceanipulchritudo coccoides]NDV62955.1 tRNA (N6-isopentenyl adenosine(37)-C2)-methylthiotransferase MiaB [Oceanipulchritudo coccoides]
MNRVYIKTYGCQMNERDSEAVAAQLRGRGYTIVADEQSADVVLLNTCAVRDQAEQKAIGKTGHLAKRKRKDPNFIIGVMGCMAQNRGEDLLERLPDLDLLVGTQKFHRVPEMLDRFIASQKGIGPRPSTIVDLGEESGSEETIREHTEGERKVSSFVSIMQGCNMHCTFCIVPKTRGAERYRSMDSICEEIEELVAAGTREVTLLGQIVNSYGMRQIPYRSGISPFVQLLERVNAIPELERIRFTSPHPRGFQKDLVEAYGRLEKLMPYVHLPLQSGSDEMLKRMRRPYSRRRFSEIVSQLREVCPDICLSTDIIVGFPGETHEEFEDTRSLFEEIRFDMAFIFKYSERSGTKAAEMGDDIPAEEKESRNQVLLEILGRTSLEKNSALVGSVQKVLLEGPARKGEGMFMGRNPGNRKVIVPASPRLVGEIVPVRITKATVTTLSGELCLTGIDESESAVLSH